MSQNGDVHVEKGRKWTARVIKLVMMRGIKVECFQHGKSVVKLIVEVLFMPGQSERKGGSSGFINFELLYNLL